MGVYSKAFKNYPVLIDNAETGILRCQPFVDYKFEPLGICYNICFLRLIQSHGKGRPASAHSCHVYAQGAFLGVFNFQYPVQFFLGPILYIYQYWLHCFPSLLNIYPPQVWGSINSVT